MTINPMKMAVDSLFNQMGRPVTHKNKVILIILTEPDEIVEVGFVPTHSPSCRAKIRISDAPNLKIGDKIDTDGKTMAVHSKPVKDIHNLIWSCDLICV